MFILLLPPLTPKADSIQYTTTDACGFANRPRSSGLQLAAVPSQFTGAPQGTGRSRQVMFDPGWDGGGGLLPSFNRYRSPPQNSCFNHLRTLASTIFQRTMSFTPNLTKVVSVVSGGGRLATRGKKLTTPLVASENEQQALRKGCELVTQTSVLLPRVTRCCVAAGINIPCWWN
jgi:hypothetical protein